MLQWVRNLLLRIKNKKQIEIFLKAATIDDLEFIAKCVKSGSLEKHFRELTKNDIKLIIANQHNGSFLATIQSVNKQIGFLYIGKNNNIFESKTRKSLSGYEINLFYILEPYRKLGIGTKVILQAEAIFRQINAKKVYVRCDRRHSLEAIALFKKLGYQDNGKVSEFPNKDLYYIILEKDII
ncbi:GNAT family N-acetyltransferase (plasmid) [Campylobacter fetus]|uniref:GNAT family N-acetyltransferase n=1 Tax=Campylobacter fetus TaxID=196 RepID=A0A974MV09_CAMFE|nr:GNAT family N-acetyltransferase [Campylobacter fetus]OCS42590.1 hypothetical protein CFVI02298_04465 [Campylobacter fetus subsp. venerealis cfvi02/298]KAA3682705.1 GNAT family N-acetyltransferase [Campylobacter fetus subsp. venerealis]OCS19705.1 hypothetical protein CFVI03596_08850 [Campylobacter fetus subsp. venerealis cfvi03/596]OCS32839.1 hypothetical protein AWR31_08205 [Campylobacter fetus subsp. venerealis]QMS59938.1 GNAT family N-acetyltransferase [Campylobacter fetus]